MSAVLPSPKGFCPEAGQNFSFGKEGASCELACEYTKDRIVKILQDDRRRIYDEYIELKSKLDEIDSLIASILPVCEED